jgi:hypothetical protein
MAQWAGLLRSTLFWGWHSRLSAYGTALRGATVGATSGLLGQTCSISEWFSLRGPLYNLVGSGLGSGGFIVITDPPRKPPGAISRMPNCYRVTFRSDSV